uniref:Uncharacterized protein n=1 Tax=Anopheles maculatus TaxID=74869 RepID=A0A182SAL2_9DIPT
MANKASPDGVDFQRHLFCYSIGLVHSKYDYSILYEGSEQTYGALDDVILKINPNAEDVNSKALYLLQAKQKQDITYTLSIQDLLHDKNNIEKYIKAYTTYMKSQAHQLDGIHPTEMIYWTTNDCHETTKRFLEEHTSSMSHLMLTIDSIKKYRIKHWKALFMFEIAQNLAIHAGSSKKKDNSSPFAYLNDSVVEALAREILEPAEQQEGSVKYPKVNEWQKRYRSY